MTPAAYFTTRRQRCIALLAAFVLFAGQLVLQQHVHADNVLESSCVVCVQADHTPGVAAAVAALQARTLVASVTNPATRSTREGATTTYLARAPPRS